MSCWCGGRCGCSRGIGSYGPVPPLAQPGYRLTIPGGPVGGQYHGYLGAYNPNDIYRSSAEPPPRGNASGHENIVGITHAQRRASYSLSPGGVRPAPRLGSLPVIVDAPAYWPGNRAPAYAYDTIIRGGVYGATAVAPMPKPVSILTPAPVTSDNCPTGEYRDAAGNCTDDWHNPYPISLPATPSPTVAANTSPTPGAGQTNETASDWLTSQSIIAGFPNWGVLAAAAAGLMFMRGGRR